MKFRDQFPFFANQTNLIYADSAATSHKPLSVINAITQFLSVEYATVHRSGYDLATAATQKFEQARSRVAELINCADKRSIVFTKGATEALNLVASGVARCDWLIGSEILICGSEHHANLLPWQRVAAQRDFNLRVMPMTNSGCLDVDAALDMITERTAIIAIAQVSNALGNLYPIAKFIQKAKQNKALSIIDGTQAVPHIDVDIDKLGCDFYAFSGHKMFAPTGTGVLYGRYSLLEKLPAYQLGGEMVKSTDYNSAVFQKPPVKFEAGTPNIAQVIGLGSAIDYIDDIGLKNIQIHEDGLLKYCIEELSKIDDMILYGNPSDRGAVIPFNIKGVHSHDLSKFLDTDKICIRAGHHCAQPIMNVLEISASARASFYLYNDANDVDGLVKSIKKTAKILK